MGRGLEGLGGCVALALTSLAGCSQLWSCGAPAEQESRDRGALLTAIASVATPERPEALFEPICSTEGFCWQLPQPQGNDLEAAWGTDRENVYVVGTGGVVLRFDGRRWVAVETGTRQDLRALWGTDANNIYIVGRRVILFFDGSAWTVTEVDAELRAVWGLGPDRIFAAGDDGALLTFNGFSWNREESGTERGLRAIWGSGRRAVFAVGDGGQLLRHDGSSWERQESGTRNDLRAIWGSGAQEVFVVGAAGTVLRFDGARWSKVGDPALPRSTLTAVWGTGPGNVWVATEQGKVLNFDGARWSLQLERCTPEPCGALAGLWGSGPRDVYAVGRHGLLLRLRSSWSTLWAPTSADDLSALWTSPAGESFAVGEGGTILRFSGGAWTASLESTEADGARLWPGALGAAQDLHDVWGTSEDDVFAVGDQGTALHFDGSAWSKLETGTDRSLRAVWGSDSADVIAVGDDVTLLHYDGEEWQRRQAESPTPLRGALFDVWGSGANNAFAVGHGGMILHYDGNTWSMHMTSVETELRTVWGTGLGRVFAAGHDDTKGTRRSLVRYDGSFWKSIALFPEQREGRVPQDIDDLWGTGRDDLYAAADGHLFHFDGAHWRQVELPPCPPIRAVSGDGGERLFLVGDSRTVIQRNELPPPPAEPGAEGGPTPDAAVEPTGGRPLEAVDDSSAPMD